MMPNEQLIVKYQQALDITLQLTQKLNEENIEAAISLIDQREAVIDELKLLDKQEEDPVQAKDPINQLISQIIAQDKVNQELMNQQKLKLQLEIRKFNQAKQAKQGYEPSYSPDAIFFDKKK